jgi:ELWxxDGT repeat protein
MPTARRVFPVIVAALVTWSAPALHAAPVQLVADLAAGSEVVPSHPRAFTRAIDRTFFITGPEGGPAELWSTYGADSGAQNEAELVVAMGGAEPRWLLDLPLPGLLLVVAGRESTGLDLWSTGGTPETTVRLARLCAAPCAGASPPVVVGYDRVYFSGFDRQHGNEPWVTDGTVAGTFRLGETCVGTCGDPVGPFAGIGEKVVFAANSRELWSTDGSGGIRRIAVLSACCPSPVRGFVYNNGYLYFDADDGVHGRELWRTDGATVAMIADLRPGSASANARPLTVFDGDVVVEATGGCPAWSDPEVPVIPIPEPQERCLWREDGDPATPPVPAGLGYGSLQAFVWWHHLYFVDDAGSAWVASPGVGPWRIEGLPELPDLATEGAVQMTLFWYPFAFPDSPVEIGLGYSGADGSAGLWRLQTLGPAAAAFAQPRVEDLLPEGHDLEQVRELIGNQGLMFAGRQADGDVEPWESFGRGGTTRVLEVAQDVASGEPQPILPVDSSLLFASRAGNAAPWPRQSFLTDGTGSGTAALDGLTVHEGAQLGGKLYLSASSATQEGLWRLDDAGTAATLIAELPQPRQLVVAKTTAGSERLWFTTSVPQGAELWISDGSPGGTQLIADVAPDWQAAPGGGGSPGGPTSEAQPFPRDLTAAPGAGVVFWTINENGYFLLWRSNGTAATTYVVGGLGAERPERFATLPQAVVFTSRSTDGATTLWGWSQDQLYRLHQLVAEGSAGTPLAARGREAFFLARSATPEAGPPRDALWRTDGSPAGTFQVSAAAHPLYSGDPQSGRELVVAGARIYFTIHHLGSDLSSITSLWVSDGSASGTQRLAATEPWGFPRDLVGTPDGGLIFSAWDWQHGREPWMSDGTTATLLADVRPGPLSSEPGPFVLATPTAAAGGGVARLYFPADDGTHGRELFTTTLDVAGGCPADAQTLCLRGGRFAVRATLRNQREPASPARAATALGLSAESGLFWLFDRRNPELMVKILDGAGINGHHWVFVASLSDLEAEITVEDRASGETRRYLRPAGNLCGLADLGAFATARSQLALAHPELRLAGLTPNTGGVDPGFRRGDGVGVSDGPSLPAVSEPSLAGLTLGSDLPVVDISPPPPCPGGPGRCLDLAAGVSVVAAWRNPRTGATGIGTPISLSDRAGGFSFFAGTNFEVLVKALDGTAINGHHWLFWGGLTDLEYELRLYDSYAFQHLATITHPAGSLCGGARFDLLP